MQLILQFLKLSLPLRIVLLSVAGAFLGAAVNLGIYRLAYCRRRFSPWCRTRGIVPPRTWIDRIPIIGWSRLERESSVHGTGFWIRPMLIELAFAVFVPWLYWWEVERHSLVVFPVAPDIVSLDIYAKAVLFCQFAAHVALLVILAVATFIDIDEQTIPDAVTVPGTLLALALAVLCPAGTLPWLEQIIQNQQFRYVLQPLRFDTPDVAAAFLGGLISLAVAIFCYLDWCLALLPRRWRLGVGPAKAWRIMWRRIFARTEWKWVLPMAALGCIAIAFFWTRDGLRWHSLVSALIGMAGGAAVIWTIRFIASFILQREAMGFGDVTLMAMIGAFLGWQPMMIILFFSPFAAMVIGILQWLLIRDNVIAFGPFLSLATVGVLICWGSIWEYSHQMFEIHWLVPSAFILCLPAMVILLLIVRVLRRTLIG